METDLRSILSVAEAAERLGRPKRTIQREAKAKIIPAVGKLSGKTGAYVFDAAVIDELAEAQKAS